MLTPLSRLLFIGTLATLTAGHSLASPSSSRLLPLIPAEAGIVAGVEDPHNPNTNGHRLLITVDTTVELDDWLSLSGVDNHRAIDELMWMAATSPRGALRENAVLIAGRFDCDHIFHAAKQNGASSTNYNGVEVIVVEPFARERGTMKDVRWLAILNGEASILGTPWLVQRSIDRYIAHSPADPNLLRRLAILGPGVNSWSVLLLPTDPAERQHILSQLSAPWIDLLRNAQELTVGFHYGATTHIDFSLEFSSNQPLSAALTSDCIPDRLKNGSLDRSHARIENLSVGMDRIEGSIAVPRKQFESCVQSLSAISSPPLTAQIK